MRGPATTSTGPVACRPRPSRTRLVRPRHSHNEWTERGGTDTTNARPTVFGRELQQFTDAGYTWDGSYLRAPGSG
jgi:hypothetical protein